MRRRSGRASKIDAALWVGLVVCLTLTGCTGRGAAERQPGPPVWHQTHRIELLAGWQITARNAGPDGESTTLSGPHRTGCVVSTWPSRPARLWWPRSPESVTVQGFPATYGDLDPDYGPYPRAVVWRNADGQWFWVSCDVDRAGILQVAEGVHSDTNPMQVPFRLSAMPDGPTMVSVIETIDAGQRTAAALFKMPSSTQRLTMAISNRPDSWFEQGPVERREFAGRPAEVRPATQTICFVTRSEPICIQGPSGEPATDWSPEARDAAIRTAELLIPVADPDDESSWVDADAAFPG